MMNIKDYATEVFNSLDENQLLEFISVFADENTLTRFESDLIASDNTGYKTYSNFSDILQEIDEEN